MEKKRIILTSRGLTHKMGKKVIINNLEKIIGDYVSFFSDKTIMLCTIKEYGINNILEETAWSLGFKKENVFIWDENRISDENAKYPDEFSVCYVTEGNTFQIADMLKQTGADRIIKESISDGGYYIGASAGALLATSSIEIASDFDLNFTGIKDFTGLNLLPASLGRTAVIPHYNKKQFEKWKKSTPLNILNKYNYIDYIPENGSKTF